MWVCVWWWVANDWHSFPQWITQRVRMPIRHYEITNESLPNAVNNKTFCHISLSLFRNKLILAPNIFYTFLPATESFSTNTRRFVDAKHEVVPATRVYINWAYIDAWAVLGIWYDTFVVQWKQSRCYCNYVYGWARSKRRGVATPNPNKIDLFEKRAEQWW